MSELFAEVCDAIPLHHAARTSRRHPERSPMHMRFSAFSEHLLTYNIIADPPVTRSRFKALRMMSHVTPCTLPCLHCGAAFFGVKTGRFCSQACRNFSRSVIMTQRRAA